MDNKDWDFPTRSSWNDPRMLSVEERIKRVQSNNLTIEEIKARINNHERKLKEQELNNKRVIEELKLQKSKLSTNILIPKGGTNNVIHINFKTKSRQSDWTTNSVDHGSGSA